MQKFILVNVEWKVFSFNQISCSYMRRLEQNKFCKIRFSCLRHQVFLLTSSVYTCEYVNEQIDVKSTRPVPVYREIIFFLSAA